MSAITAEFEPFLTSHPPLAEKVLEFLYEPLRYLHPIRLSKWVPEAEVQNAIVQTRCGWDTLNDYLLKNLKLDQELVLPPILPRQQLLYAQIEKLRWLAKFAGAAVCADDIRHTIQRKEREELLEAIGDEIYQFVLRKAIFFRPKGIPMNLLPGKTKPLPQRVLIQGKFCIAACLSDLPTSLLTRFQLKFSPGESWHFPKFRKSLAVDHIWAFLEHIWERYCS